MSELIIETDRVQVIKLEQEASFVLANLMHCSLQEAQTYIREWSLDQDKQGYTVYGVILKSHQALCGYCGAREIMWHERPEVEMLWYIEREFPTDPNDDLDFETAFYIRNYLIKQFNVKSMVAFVDEHDARSMNLAEELDMISDESFEENGKKWLVYHLETHSPKCLASLGSEENEAVRTSIQNRKDLLFNPATMIRKPRLKPR